MKGWGGGTGGQNARHVPRNPGKRNFSDGIYPGSFGGVSRGRPKSLRKESFCSIFCPTIGVLGGGVRGRVQGVVGFSFPVETEERGEGGGEGGRKGTGKGSGKSMRTRLLKLPFSFETLATWYRTPKREFQESAGGGAGTGAGKNGGAGRSAGTGAGRLAPL